MFGEFGETSFPNNEWFYFYTILGIFTTTFILFNLGIAIMGGAYEYVNSLDNKTKLDYACLCQYIVSLETLALWKCGYKEPKYLVFAEYFQDTESEPID